MAAPPPALDVLVVGGGPAGAAAAISTESSTEASAAPAWVALAAASASPGRNCPRSAPAIIRAAYMPIHRIKVIRSMVGPFLILRRS